MALFIPTIFSNELDIQNRSLRFQWCRSHCQCSHHSCIPNICFQSTRTTGSHIKCETGKLSVHTFSGSARSGLRPRIWSCWRISSFLFISFLRFPVTNKNNDIVIINWLHSSHRLGSNASGFEKLQLWEHPHYTRQQTYQSTPISLMVEKLNWVRKCTVLSDGSWQWLISVFWLDSWNI